MVVAVVEVEMDVVLLTPLILVPENTPAADTGSVVATGLGGESTSTPGAMVSVSVCCCCLLLLSLLLSVDICKIEL